MSQLTEYNPTEAALAELRQRYADVAFDLTTTKGDKEARAARKELVTLRTSLEAKRQEREARARIAEQERQAREAMDAAEAAARAARDAQEATERAARETAEAKARAERERLDAERREREEQEAAARRAEEERQIAAQRAADRLLHGREMLAAFVAEYATDPEFAAIVPAMREFLQPAMKEAA